MVFKNHCTIELYLEAKKIISLKDWHPTYKSQHLSRVEYVLEKGKMIDISNGMMTIPFEIHEVKSLI